MDEASARIGPSPEVGVNLPRTLLVGQSRAVHQLARALQEHQATVEPIGCLLPTGDADAPAGLPLLGSFADLERVLAECQADLALLTLPAVMNESAADLSRRLENSGVTWRFMPTLADLLTGRAAAAASPGGAVLPVAAAIDPVQLIGRRPRSLDEPAIEQAIGRRAILITGAGGSIGSELARLVCRFQPQRLILLERSENALFEVQRHLRQMHPQIPISGVLHDVTNVARTLAVMREHRPQVIFHAAAHKHVPVMEDHPAQAVENNFYGTRSIADAAHECGAERFVMISTDKAVNPTSVMGATKRLAELYVQWLGGRSQTVYSMVRFGNVLGSVCSVVPIWTQQLAQGLPLTVTHRDMRRYFMTIPEAAGLVIQSAAYAGLRGNAQGGEVFLLDMGEPIRIVDLAERFVRCHGLEPGRDVRIEFTGIRPGEKLYEELAYDGEDMMPTPHASVRIWRTARPDHARMTRIIERFDRLRGDGTTPASREAVLAALRFAVPEMITTTAVRAAAG